MEKITPKEHQTVDAHTELIGLMAYPIRHSSSPAMHNEAFRYLGLNLAYMAFEVEQDQLEGAVNAIRALRMLGSNVSMPNKIKVKEYLDELSEAAELIGSVNTIVNDNGKLIGHNTDGLGYVQSLEYKGIPVKGKKFVIVGAGGAGTAMQIQCALSGAAEIHIFNTKDKFFDNALVTAEKIRSHTDCLVTVNDIADLDLLREKINACDILANSTGVGMKPLEGKTWLPDTSYLRPDLIVTDSIYAPTRTKFLQMAEEAGCKVVMNGFGMMLFQGAAAFKLWTGIDMPIEHIREVLNLKD